MDPYHYPGTASFRNAIFVLSVIGLGCLGIASAILGGIALVSGNCHLSAAFFLVGWTSTVTTMGIIKYAQTGRLF